MNPPIRFRVALCLFAGMTFVTFGIDPAAAAEEAKAPSPAEDYLQPSSLAATITSLDGSQTNELFRLHRRATQDGTTVRVLREYTLPDGTVAARERVVYQAGRLLSFDLEEPLSGAHGGVTIQANPDHPGNQRLKFDYVSESGGHKSGVEELENDTLVNDMVGPFIASHWADLMKGEALKTRFVAIARAETVGFKFVKESETTWRGRPVVIVRMQPTSWIIAQIVKPLRFVVDREPPHRVLQYTGRTTPRVRKGKHWEDCDAVTLFEWK